MNFRVLPEANADVTEALSWLVQRRRYRALRALWSAWQAGLDAITANPRMYSPVEDAPEGVEVRCYPLPRYRYRIVYVVLPSEVLVLALTRGRRGHEPWQSRLPEGTDH